MLDCRLPQGKEVPVNPDVVADSGHPNPLFERGYAHDIRVDTQLPGPGTSIHVLFNSTVDENGQTVITDAKVHADIGNPQDVVGIAKHTRKDVIWAASTSKKNNNCPVKFVP